MERVVGTKKEFVQTNKFSGFVMGADIQSIYNEGTDEGVTLQVWYDRAMYKEVFDLLLDSYKKGSPIKIMVITHEEIDKTVEKVAQK